MDIKLLDELERLEKAATPGPWQTESPIRDGDGWAAGVVVAAVSRGQCVYSLTTGGSMPEADRQLIAFLRTHAPTLIAAAREGVRWKAEAMAARGLLHDSGLHIYAQHTEGQCVMMDDAAHEYVNERAANPALTPTPEPTYTHPSQFAGPLGKVVSARRIINEHEQEPTP